MKILITGSAGFIGFHLSQKLIKEGYDVIGIDNINDYYDVKLKYDRLYELGIEKEKIEYNNYSKSKKFENFNFIKLDLVDKENILRLVTSEKFDIIVNLAAQAGVRYSLVNPYAYIDSNITGFLNILEGCKKYDIKHLVFASSSSVYGLNTNMPFSVSQNVDHPVSLYAASKKSNELFAHVYSYLYDIPVTGLRFFTVYGPWGRPDMALFLFTKAIINDEPIEIYNNGDMERDFTYIDDIIEGIYGIMLKIPQKNNNWNSDFPDPSSSVAPYRIYNIGNNKPVRLMEFIEEIEKNLNKKAKKIYKPLQPGDVVKTWADVTDLEKEISYLPHTPISVGVKRFVEWYCEYYKIKI